jgi:hypothetical protein
MFGKRAVDAELKRALGLSLDKLEPLFAAGGDTAGGGNGHAISSSLRFMIRVGPVQ